MKRILKTLILLAAVLVFCVIGCSCFDSEAENKQMLAFYPLDDGTLAVGSGGARYLSQIEIPSVYDGKAVTAIVEDAFSDCKNLESVNIPASVKSIMENAFAGCKNLKTVTYGGDELSLYSVNGQVFSNVEGVSFEKGAIDGTMFMNLDFENSGDNDTVVKLKLEDALEGITKLVITPKLNDVTDMFNSYELTAAEATVGAEIDFGTYGLFKNIEVKFCKNDSVYAECKAGGVAVTADHYNFAYLNATYPVLVASLKIDEITDGGKIPTFVGLERNAAYNWDELPEGVSCFPVFTEKEATEGEFHSRREGVSDYIKELYAISPDSQFTLYVVDNYLELILEFLVANGIPESNWNTVMLSDGSGTAHYLSTTFNVDNPREKFDKMVSEWNALKEYYYSKGEYEFRADGKYIDEHISERNGDTYSVLVKYAYVITKAQDNAEWWVNRLRAGENLSAINAKDPEFTNEIIASAKSFYTNSLLAALDEEQTESFKKLYNFNGEMFEKAETENKKVMIILGTAWHLEEETFYEQIKLTMKFYGDDYIYYYKGHPGYPTSLFEGRKNLIEKLNTEGYTLYELDNAIAAEVILFFYPGVYCSGWGTSTFDSLESYEKAGVLYNIPYADKDNYTYGELMKVFSTVISSDTEKYGNIQLEAGKKYCLIEYNNTAEYEAQVSDYAKHEIAIYNVTDDEICYYKSVGENTWKQVTSDGGNI